MSTINVQAQALDDAEVVERVLGGEVALFEIVMRRYNQRLFRAARSIVDTDHEAEDVLQEAYVLAYAKLETFEGRARLSTWLGRIVVHEAYRRMRRRRREPTRMSEDQRSDRSQSPDAVAATRQTARLLERALDELPEVHRSVFMLRVVEGMTVADTAAHLEIPESTVKTRLYRARRLLARRLAERHDAALPEVHRFLGARCDRMVAAVLARLRGRG